MAKNYLNNKDLLVEVRLSKKLGYRTAKLDNMFYVLGQNIIRKFHRNNKQDNEDILQTAYLQIYSNWSNFDETKSSNAFAFYSEIIKRGIAQGFNVLYLKKGAHANPILKGKYFKCLSLEQERAEGVTLNQII